MVRLYEGAGRYATRPAVLFCINAAVNKTPAKV
jgi:hypothetical protein